MIAIALLSFTCAVLAEPSAHAAELADNDKARLVKAAKLKAEIYTAKAAAYLSAHPGIELSRPISDYYGLSDKLANAPELYLLQSESEGINLQECERGASGVFNNEYVTFCDASFEWGNAVKSFLIRVLLHEETHAVQKRRLGVGARVKKTDAKTGLDIECWASETAGVIMLIAGDYELEDDYTITKRCGNVAAIFNHVHSSLKKGSRQIAAGMKISVKSSLSARALREPPRSYISTDSAEDVVSKLKKHRAWHVLEVVPPAEMWGSLKFTGNTMQPTKISLQADGSDEQFDIVFTSMGLDIYSDELEKYFGGMITVQ